MKNKIAIVGAGLVGNSLAKRLKNYCDVILIEKVEDLEENSRVVLNQNEAELLLDDLESNNILSSPLYLSAMGMLDIPISQDYYYRKNFYKNIPDSRAYKKHKRRR